jgi:hypothetical protein
MLDSVLHVLALRNQARKLGFFFGCIGWLEGLRLALRVFVRRLDWLVRFPCWKTAAEHNRVDVLHTLTRNHLRVATILSSSRQAVRGERRAKQVLRLVLRLVLLKRWIGGQHRVELPPSALLRRVVRIQLLETVAVVPRDAGTVPSAQIGLVVQAVQRRTVHEIVAQALKHVGRG